MTTLWGLQAYLRVTNMLGWWRELLISASEAGVISGVSGVSVICKTARSQSGLSVQQWRSILLSSYVNSWTASNVGVISGTNSVSVICKTATSQSELSVLQWRSILPSPYGKLNSVQCQSRFRHQECVSVICSTIILWWWIETHMSGTCKAFVRALAHDLSACAPHTSYLVRVFLHAPMVCLWSAAQTYPNRYVRYTHVSQLTSNLMPVSGVWSAAPLYHNQHMCYRHMQQLRSIQYWSHFRHQQCICYQQNNDTTVKTTCSTYVWRFKSIWDHGCFERQQCICGLLRKCITVNP